MSSFKSNENIHKKEDGSYYVVSASSVGSRLVSWYVLALFVRRLNIGYLAVEAGIQ